MKYIFLDNNDSTASPSGYYAVEEGGPPQFVGLVIEGEQLPPFVKIQELKKREDLFLIISKEKFKEITTTEKQKTTMAAMKSHSTIQVGEQVNGQPQKFRPESEYQAGSTGSKIIKLSLDATALTLPEANVIIGDAYQHLEGEGIGDATKKLTAAGLVIGGTYGAQTLRRIKDFSKMGLRLHGITGFAAGDAPDSYFDDGNRTVKYKADVLGLEGKEPVEYSYYQKGDQFQLSIRNVPGFRFTLGTFTALVQNLTAGDKVTLHFKAYSLGAVNNMQLL